MLLVSKRLMTFPIVSHLWQLRKSLLLLLNMSLELWPVHTRPVSSVVVSGQLKEESLFLTHHLPDSIESAECRRSNNVQGGLKSNDREERKKKEHAQREKKNKCDAFFSVSACSP